MMSKNSFLVSLKENSKRRIWLWIVSELFWLFYYPVGMAMLMSRKMEHNRIDGMVGEAARKRLAETAEAWLGGGYNTTAVLVTVVAVICAIQGFSYLYSRKKVDLYHSVPVKKSRRFAVIFTNGILICFVPYLVNLLLAMVIAWFSGGMDGHIFSKALIAAVLHLLLYLGIYGFAILAVMLTGNLVITVFATVIFLVYELIVRLLVEAYMIKFFSYYCYYSSRDALYLSPFWYFGQAAEVFDGGGLPLAALFGMLLLTAAITGLAYYCYWKRPSEAAGKAMAFEKTKAVVKLFLTVPFSLGAALIVDDIVVSNGVLVVFSVIIAVILSNAVIEVIYEADIKAAFRKKRQILVSGLCTAAIASVFCFDLIGYDAWEPSPEKLEDAVFLFSRGNMEYVDENMKTVGWEEYALGKPGVKDIEAICELSSKKTEEGDFLVWMDVAYRMKNGKVVWRNFAVNGDEEELLNRIIGSEEYKKMAYQNYDDNDYAYIKEYVETHKIKEIVFHNGFRVENLNPEEADTVRELWKKDMENFNYSTLRDEFQCGVIEMETKGEWNQNTYSIYGSSISVYPSFSHLRGYLEEKGIGTDTYLKAEDIESITVTNNHTEEAVKLRKEMEKKYGDNYYMIDMEDVSVTKTFTEEDKIKELAEAVYPSYLSRQWKGAGEISSDYYVSIKYKDGRTDSAVYRGDTGASLIADRIPGWLDAETAYK